MAKRGRKPGSGKATPIPSHPGGIIPAGRPGLANPIDIHVGGRVRLRRSILGMSQETLGVELGLTFQQVQKYERGANRIGSSRLWDMSNILDVPVQFFFDDMTVDVSGQSPRLRAGLAEMPQSEHNSDPMVRQETLELIRSYYRISDPKIRKNILDLCKSMSNSN